jgi:hypothetical protein
VLSRSTLLVAALSFAAGAGAVVAQQATQQVTRREPQFDAPEASAHKSIIYPKQPLSLHRHDIGRAVVALTDATLDVVDSTGKRITTYNWQKGKAYWLPADPPGRMHADVNPGTTPIEVIVVQLKK